MIASKHTFKASWKQPEDVDRYFRERIESPSVNVCSGKSPLGDVKVDADPDMEPDVIADAIFKDDESPEYLPFPDATFKTVLVDFPWKLNYFNRQRGFFECVRVCQPDGRIIMNALWRGESDNTVVEEVALTPDDGRMDAIARWDDPWANVSAIVTHRKQPGQTTL